MFGTPEWCADRLLRAQEETRVCRVFLFPAHTWGTVYDPPEAEVEAFGKVIGPRLEEALW
jgi:5,10-methylenetetrahydromethanopterin reductase